MQFTITTEVEAPPEVVFAVLSEVERWPEWTPTVSQVERLGDAGAPLALGGRLRIVQPKVPPAEWTVTALEPGRGFRLFSRSPGATVEANHWAEPTGAANHSRVTLSVTFAGFLGWVIGWMMRGLNERTLRRKPPGSNAGVRSELGAWNEAVSLARAASRTILLEVDARPCTSEL